MSKFYLFQTDDERIMFRSFEFASGGEELLGVKTGEGEYRCVESGYFEESPGKRLEALENLFIKFNTVHPKGERSRSMSMSDIVLIWDEKDQVRPYRAYYVDTFGFVELKPSVSMRSEGDVEPLVRAVSSDQTPKGELLDRIIENLLIAEHPGTVIKYLLYLGFAETDLKELGFSEPDIAHEREQLQEEGKEENCYSPIFP